MIFIRSPTHLNTPPQDGGISSVTRKLWGS